MPACCPTRLSASCGAKWSETIAMSEIPLWNFPTRVIVEGNTSLEVPEVTNLKGPASSRETPVFYNDAMALSRDVHVLLVKALQELGLWNDGSFLEGLTATGARGLRLAHEVGLSEVVLNDANPQAVALAQHNARLNELSDKVEVTQARLQVLLAQRTFAAIDLDPFGTPAPFLAAALQALRNKGILSLSATDLPALCGAQPRVCQRRYQARPLRGPACSEFGVRLLLGWVIRQAATFDWGVVPLLAYAEGHHLRLYLRLQRGGGRADESLSGLGMIARPDNQDYLKVSRPDLDAGGPFWLGPLGQRDLVERMAKILEEGPLTLAQPQQLHRLVSGWSAELDQEPFPVGFFSMDELAREAKCGPPSLVSYLEHLQEAGHTTTRTSFDPTGVRTGADWSTCVKLMKDLQTR